MDTTLTFPKENRGKPRKYEFEGINIDEVRRYPNAETSNVLYCAKQWAKKQTITPKFQARKLGKYVYLKRIE